MEPILEAPAKPVCTLNDEESQKAIETKIYELKVENEEFELFLNLHNSDIEFKVMPKNIIPTCYYIEKFNLENINKESFTLCSNLKEVFIFYCKILQKNKVKLMFSEGKSIIILNFKNIINFDEEVEANIKLKEVKLNKDDILQELLKEVIKLKNGSNNDKDLNSNEKINDLKKEMNEEINSLRKNYEEKINNLENKIVENEKKIKELNDNMKLLLEEYNNKKEKERIEDNKKKEEEKIYALNDNVNLINNFKFDSVNHLRNINVISNDLNLTFLKSVAVFTLIKINERFYEIAYPDNKNGYNIIIYSLSLDKIESTINNAHTSNIHRIKHYYNPSNKSHLLLSASGDKSIKLWNISSFPIVNILKINNCFDGDNFSPFCLMFLKTDFFILGGSRNEKKKIWNQNGYLIGNIEKSNLDYGRFIEAAYLDNKTYILLSGRYHSECLNFEDNTIKAYKSKKNNSEDLIINLFKKDKTVYLISGDEGGNLYIFDFNSTNLIKEIKINGGNIKSLCSINEKSLILSQDKDLKIIDMDKYCVANGYSGHNYEILGVEKIKIPEKGEYVISYDSASIKIWK